MLTPLRSTDGLSNWPRDREAQPQAHRLAGSLLACSLSADHFMIACRAMDETYIRVGGKWRYLWRAVDQFGQMIDFRLTARRDMNAARAFFRQARDTIRIYAPVVITTDKAPTYPRIISEMNEFSFPGDEITHINRKGQNNRIESDHASLKRIIDPGRGFQTLRTAKATLKGVEVHRMIKRGHYHGGQQGITAEIDFTDSLFGIAA